MYKCENCSRAEIETDQSSRSHGADDDETAPSAPQIEVSPAPVAFADDLQVLTVDRSARKGTPIGQIKIANPGRRRLTWTMRHRYRYGGKSFSVNHWVCPKTWAVGSLNNYSVFESFEDMAARE